MEFKQWLNHKIELVEDGLRQNFQRKDNMQSVIYDACQYSLFAGGKRLRPVIMLASYEIFKDDCERIIPYACAMEMIHTYSLIHDDLPAMDNDDYRRGRLSNHKKFDEATAILAGDALLNKAFEVMLTASVSFDDKQLAIQAMQTIANSSGTEGMIGGQIVDMYCNDSIKTIDDLKYLQDHKTGAIIKSSAMAGGILAGASEKEIEALKEFAGKLGLAFQIQDDILDVEGDENVLGKPIGSDEENNKKTYVTMLGLETAKKTQEKLTYEAVKSLECFGDRASNLTNLAIKLLDRNH